LDSTNCGGTNVDYFLYYMHVVSDGNGNWIVLDGN
jgi:hypothetical protein